MQTLHRLAADFDLDSRQGLEDAVAAAALCILIGGALLAPALF